MVENKMIRGEAGELEPIIYLDNALEPIIYLDNEMTKTSKRSYVRMPMSQELSSRKEK